MTKQEEITRFYITDRLKDIIVCIKDKDLDEAEEISNDLLEYLGEPRYSSSKNKVDIIIDDDSNLIEYIISLSNLKKLLTEHYGIYLHLESYFFNNNSIKSIKYNVDINKDPKNKDKSNVFNMCDTILKEIFGEEVKEVIIENN